MAEPLNGNGKRPKRAHPKDHRCAKCGRMLFRGFVLPGSMVEIRCPRCSFMAVWPCIIIPPKTTNRLTTPQELAEILNKPCNGVQTPKELIAQILTDDESADEND